MGKQSRERQFKYSRIAESREIEGLVKRARFYDEVIRRVELKHKPLMKTSPVIDLQPVDAMILDRDYEICEPVRPPFDSVFMEWASRGDREIVMGALVTFFAPDSEHFGGFASMLIDGIPESLLTIDIFLKMPQSPEYLGTMIFGLDSEYKWVSSKNCSALLADKGRKLVGDKALKSALHVYSGVALYALQIINCRNVTLVDHMPDPLDNAAHEKYFGAPMTRYKTLAIKSMGKEASSDQPQQQFDVMPLHLRRGNFAHYSDDAPLFGKYTGTFWRPATVVGNEKNGMVVKDYKVLAPQA